MTATVAVTGAARGIGAAIAQRFAAQGWHVVPADVSPEVEVTARRIAKGGGLASAVVADVASAEGAQALGSATGGQLDALVNNAGITRDALIAKMTRDQFAAAVRVNLDWVVPACPRLSPRRTGPWRCVHGLAVGGAAETGSYGAGGGTWVIVHRPNPSSTTFARCALLVSPASQPSQHGRSTRWNGQDAGRTRRRCQKGSPDVADRIWSGRRLHLARPERDAVQVRS